MVNESFYIRGTFFANKVLLGFDHDAIIWHGTNLLTFVKPRIILLILIKVRITKNKGKQ
jgi:hypothetical protein